MADTNDLLQQLLDEIKKQNRSYSPPSGGGGGGTGGGSNAGTKALSTGFDTLSRSTSGLGSAMINGTTSISAMSGAITGVAGTFKDLTAKIPFANTMLGMLGDSVQGTIGYLEANVSVYRTLSKVGLGLAGDVGQLGQLAGNANMGLGPFAELISQNKDLLLGFSDGLDGGTKNLSAMLKEFSEGSENFQRDFMSLGFTLDESNEFFTRNLLIQRRTNLLTGKSQADAAKAATDLATEMSTLSKLTGEDVKSIQDKILQEQMAGDNALMIRQMEAQGFAEAGNAHADIVKQLGMLGPEYVQMFKEYAQYGTLMSDQSKDFANQNKEAADMIFGSAMAFRGHNADEATRMTKEATALTLEYQRSVEFMQMGQQAMLGGPYEAAKKSFENTQQIQRRIDAILAEDPSMSVAQAIDKMMKDAAKQTQEQIDEGTQDTALGTVVAIEQQASKALGTLNQTAGSIISDSQNLFATVKSLATESIKLLEESANFAFEALSETNQELVKEIAAKEGKVIETGTGQVTVTKELVEKLNKFVDPTTSRQEKTSLRTELQALGLSDKKGNITTSKADLLNSSEAIFQDLQKKNAFGKETETIINKLRMGEEGTAKAIEDTFPGIYKTFQDFFESWKNHEAILKEANAPIIAAINEQKNQAADYQRDQALIMPDTNTPTSPSKRAQANKENSVEESKLLEKNNLEDAEESMSKKLSNSMFDASVVGQIDLHIPADQFSVSSASPVGTKKSEQIISQNIKNMLGPVSESYMKTEKLITSFAANDPKLIPKQYDYPQKQSKSDITNETTLVQNMDDLNIMLGKTNSNIELLNRTLHGDMTTLLSKFDSLIGINTYGNTQRDTNLRYMRDIVS